MNTYEQAVEYLGRGYSVIPIVPNGKKPLVSWAEFQTRQPDMQELSEWFEDTDNNIAIVTGKISNLNVIDCDSPDAIHFVRSKKIGKQLVSKTGRGYQYFFKHKDGARNFQKRSDLPDIDFRGEGGYVVVAPSIHPSGAQYEWARYGKDLEELPEWVLAEEKDKTPIIDLSTGVESNRNMALTRLAGLWVKTHSFKDCLYLADEWNKQNKEPLSGSEITTTVNSIWRAEHKSKTISTEEIVTMKSLESKVDDMYENGITKGTSTGWVNVDRHYTVREKEWTLVTGIPSHGKTEFLDNLMVNLAKDHEWGFGVISAENMPHERHTSGLIEKFVGKPFQKNTNGRMSEREFKDALNFLNKYFFFMNPPENDYSIERVIEIAKMLIDKHNVKGIVIDPWNELDNTRDKHTKETDEISRILTQLRRFARTHKVHVWVVAHPAKLQKQKDGTYPVPTPYDVSGSAHWRNKADNAICVWRDVVKNDFITNIHIQKIRFKEIGSAGLAKLSYNLASGTYDDYEEPIKNLY